MNIVSYVFLGLSVVFIAASYAVPVNLAKKILNCLIIPFLCGALTPFLISRLPDSFHNLLLITSASFFLSLYVIFTTINDSSYSRKLFTIISQTAFILSLLPVINLFRTIFYIEHIPAYTVIAGSLVYLAILIAFIIFLKKQKPGIYVPAILIYLESAFLNFLAFLNLVYKTGLYAPFLFTGTLIILLLVIFENLNKYCFKIKNGAIISKTCLIAGYTLICTASTLLVYFGC